MSLAAEVGPEHAWAVEEVRERAAFVALAAQWDALADACGAPPFLRHGFIRVWLDNFAPHASWRVIVVGDSAGQLVGALPLLEQRSRMHGIPVRELCAAANPHSCRFDILAAEPERVAPAIWSHLSAQSGWDVLRLIDVPEGGVGDRLQAHAADAGWPVGVWESLRSPFVVLPSTIEGLQQRLSSKLRANLRRRRRKLEELGTVELQHVTQASALAAFLEEGFQLEESGWKGKRGTAIAQDGATWGFYTELAREAAHAGTLSLYFLRVEGRAVAFQLGLERGGRFYLLKPAYDEALSECSPGQLLMEDVLRDCVARGLTELDFLGPDMPWKRDWAQEARVHRWLYVFAPTRFGRALRDAKFRWLPAAKEVIARWRR